jgi:hypothetical protein
MIHVPQHLFDLVMAKTGDMLEQTTVGIKYSEDPIAPLLLLQEIWAWITRNTFCAQTDERNKQIVMTCTEYYNQATTDPKNFCLD